MIPTPEQAAVVEYVRANKGNLVVEALAGAGKTSTALMALEVIPQKSILMAAFNRSIADELTAKMPKMPKTHAIHVKTFNALGWGNLRTVYRHLDVSRDGTEIILQQACKGRPITFNQRRWAVRLLKLVKETTTERVLSPKTIQDIGVEHEIFGFKATASDIDETIEHVIRAYEFSQHPENLTTVDFCDQVWMPSVLKLPPASRYQAIIIDELQDISEPQFVLLQSVMLANTRMIAIGDQRQAIYGWRAGMGDRAWGVMRQKYDAHTLKLTVSFRCSAEVVKVAQQIVPEIRALPDNTGGSVSTISLADLPHHFVGGKTGDERLIHTFVLSRLNDALLDCALFLHRNNVAFQLAGGKELMAPLIDLIDNTIDHRNEQSYRDSVKAWVAKTKAKAEKQGSPSLDDKANQYSAMLIRALDETAFLPGQKGVVSPFKVKSVLQALLAPNQSGVLLSTVHKVKGLEADRVFLLKESFGRHRGEIHYLLSDPPMITPTALVPEEELNIEYVAITRARWHLVWVTKFAESDVVVGDLDEAITLTDLDKLSIEQLEEDFIKAEREAVRLSSLDKAGSDKWSAYATKVLTALNTKSKAKK